MLNKLSFLSLFLFSSLVNYAQTPEDALRYSILDIGGTARTVGIGGAIGALGADFSVASTNPAGIAMYRSSELTFTPTFYLKESDAILTTGTGNDFQNDDRSNFNFNNVGFVFANNPYSPKWKTSNVAIGVNRIASFHSKFYYEGRSQGSYTDRFLELAIDETGAPLSFGQLDPFEASLAAETGALIDLTNDPLDPRWETDFLDDPEVDKDQVVSSSGATSELLFAWAGNYDEKLMIGLSVGVPIVSFSQSKTYREIDTGGSRDGDIPNFNDLSFEERLVTSGVGVNAKLGFIYRFSQAVRIGLAVHSPTLYSLTDNYSTTMAYSFNDLDGFETELSAGSPDGTFDYRMTAPWRLQGSFGYLIQKKGFVAAEIEYVDYSDASFNLTRQTDDIETRQYENELNGEIDDFFGSAINLKIGGEAALNDFRVRAGFGLNGNPYESRLSLNSTAISIGGGWRSKGFYTDFAYKLRLINEEYAPYRLFDSSEELRVDIDGKVHRILWTLGFRF